MSLVDHAGKVVVIFATLNNGLPKLNGFKVVKTDNTLWKVDLEKLQRNSTEIVKSHFCRR